jgi:transcription antitermination factor NusA-like protein
MATEQKHSTYLSEAESRLRQLSPEKLRVAVAIIAYLQKIEENEATEKILLNIPDFAKFLREIEQNEDKLENTVSNQIALDEEVWQAYLAVEKKWEEVFIQLADS